MPKGVYLVAELDQLLVALQGFPRHHDAHSSPSRHGRHGVGDETLLDMHPGAQYLERGRREREVGK